MKKMLALSMFTLTVIGLTFSPYLLLTSQDITGQKEKKMVSQKHFTAAERMELEYVCAAPKKLMRKTYARS